MGDADPPQKSTLWKIATEEKSTQGETAMEENRTLTQAPRSMGAMQTAAWRTLPQAVGPKIMPVLYVSGEA